MNLSTILANFTRTENDNVYDFGMPPTPKPDSFWKGDPVINNETGECARIINIVPYPYAIDGDFDHDIWCAYVVGYSHELNSNWSDHWLYDDMSLWVGVETSGWQQ